jgi:CHAD domain-containing protein
MARRRRTTTTVEEPTIAEVEPVETQEVEAHAEEPAALPEVEPVELEEQPDFGQGLSALVRSALHRRGQRLLDLLNDAQQELSSENVHQLRVSTRRLAAILELSTAVVGDGPTQKLRRKLKQLRRQLGPLRDLQRQLEWLSEEPLLDDYLTERAAILPKAIKKTHKALTAYKGSWFEKRLEILDALLAAVLEEESDASELLTRQTWEGLLSAMSLADEVEPDHSFSYHPLRISLKRFRYQAEVISEVGLPNQLDQANSWDQLKALQDSLGHLQDIEVLCCHLDLYFAETPPVRETQSRVFTKLLKERRQVMQKLKLTEVEWENFWAWPEAEVESLEETPSEGSE